MPIIPPRIFNIGNSCFGNAIIQSLLACNDFNSILVSQRNIKPGMVISNYRKACIGLPVSMDISMPIIKLIKKCEFYGAQKDAHECLIFFLDRIHDALDKKNYPNKKTRTQIAQLFLLKIRQLYRNDYSVVSFCFSGEKLINIQCGNCKHSKIVVEKYRELMIQAKGSDTIEDTLDDYFSPTYLNNYKCQRCGGEDNINMQIYLLTTPKYLIIVLKRFRADLKKITGLVDFSESLILDGNYANKENYDLVAQINHSGTLKSGHYTAYVTHGGKWFFCDDSRIARASFGNHNKKDAYILIYHKRT